SGRFPRLSARLRLAEKERAERSPVDAASAYPAIVQALLAIYRTRDGALPGSQPTRLAVWTCRNSKGILVASIRTGINTPRALPSRASFLTQSEATEWMDHSTIRQRASVICSSIT